MEEELPMRVDNKGEQLIGDRLKALKREVKQIMEEAVTRKFINEESSSVTSLCAAVESCLQHGLKKKVLGLFGSVSTFGLLLKISKMCPPANAVVKIVLEMEQKYFKDHKPQTNGVIDLEKFKRHSSGSVAESSSNSRPPTDLPGAYRYLWIRVALFEKLLAIIVDYLANNASKFYEKEALMMDPVASTMTASLLVGPCALDYSKMKTQDHLWTDPPADELMQRHKIQPYSSINRVPSGNLLSPRSPRPSLNVKRTGSLGPDEATQRLSGCARDYVMSLHQNYKATLLYGKNNVSVHPAECKAPLKGYLALYQAASGSLMVRWTPNELVHSKSEPVADESDEDKSYMWKFALNLNIDDIVYIHVHQQADTGGGIIFVGADGVQHPPIQFPLGQHPLSFLTCLETGLLPWGQLEPPLWLQRGKGKVFPKLKRRTSVTSPPTISANVSFSSVVVDNDTTGDSLNSTTPVGRQNSDSTEFPFETNDFVFRIIPVNKPSVSKVVPPKSKFIHSDSEPSKNSKVVSITGFSSKLKDRILSLSSMSPPSIRNPFVNSLTITPSSEGSPAVTPTFKSLECVFEGQPTTPDINPTSTADNHISTDDNTKAVQSASPKQDRSLKSVCDSMRHQILCRAFYGWLAHCRHLRTIRTHLACLVELNNNVSVELTGEVQSTLTREEWEKILATKTEDAKFDLYKRIYLGCVEDNELRKDVWPYLLGFFKFEATPEQNQRLLDQTQTKYESTVTDWLSVEAIVKQRDIEAFKAARQARESRYSDIPLVGKQSISLSNDVVFESEDDDIDEYLATDTIPSSRAVAKRSKAAKGPVEVGSKPEAEPTASVADSDSGICALGEFKEELKSIGEANESLEDTDKSPDSVMLSPGTNAHPPLSAKNSNELPDATDLRQRKMFYVTDSGRSTPEEGDGGIFSKELIETFALNLHRIEKDVLRCDRNYFYFTQSNLEKLKNIMCTYVWNHLDIGYIQGMCDLAAPLLVIFDDEVMAYGCFCELMHRMAANFPHGGQMDIHFANMRALIQVLDPELFDLMHQNGDYTHFYFCYRWFLLDFKRELVYADVFRVWEVIWAACHVSSQHFVLFLALALVQHYRDIILENNMDFTDIIKFFNEMAEKHDANLMMKSARSLVAQLQTVIKSNSH